jgi:hypothetical protein
MAALTLITARETDIDSERMARLPRLHAAASERANQPFRMAILPGRAWRNRPVTNAHGTKPPGENLAIDPVAIPNRVFGRAFPL